MFVSGVYVCLHVENATYIANTSLRQLHTANALFCFSVEIKIIAAYNLC